MLTTMLADAYIRLQYQYDSRDIAARQLRNRTDTVRLVQLRHAQGLDSRVSMEECCGLDSARAALAEASEQIKLTRNSIAALLGRGPDRGLDILRPRLQMRRPVGLPDALSANLLGRNPEVVAARWRVEAAARNIGVARAQFYPDVNLMAFVGYQSLGLNNLFSSGSDIGSVGPAISLPLLKAGVYALTTRVPERNMNTRWRHITTRSHRHYVKLPMRRAVLPPRWTGQKRPPLLCPTAKRLINWQKPGTQEDWLTIRKSSLLKTGYLGTAGEYRHTFTGLFP